MSTPLRSRFHGVLRPARVDRRALDLACASLLVGTGVAYADLRDPSAWEIQASHPTALDVIAWRDGLVAAVDGGGLMLFDPTAGTVEFLDTTDGLSSLRVQSLAVDASGRLWVGTDDAGILRLETSGSVRAITALQQQLDVEALAIDGAFAYYGGPQGGGSVAAGLAEQTFTTDNGMPSDTVQDIAAAGGRAWFATDAGVALFDRAANQLSVVVAGLPALDVRAIHADVDGVVAGTTSGLYRLDESTPGSPTWVSFVPALGVSVRDIARRGDQWAVLGPGNAVYTLAGNASSWTTSNADGTTITSNALAFDAEGTLWIAGARITAGRIASDPRALVRALDGRSSPDTRSLFSPNVRSIAIDGAGGAWIGGFPVFDGVTHWRADGTLVAYNRVDTGSSNGFLSGTKNGIVLAPNGDVWVSTFTRGVTRLRPASNDDPDAASYLHLTPDNSPLRSERVRAMALDPKGRLWLASSGEDVTGDLNVGIDVLLDPEAPLDPASWLKITPSNSQLAGIGIWSLDFQGTDVVWITIENEGLQRWDFDGPLESGDIEPFALNASLQWDLVSTLPEDGGGIAIDRPRDLSIGADGRLWLATDNSGLFAFDYDDFLIDGDAVERFFSSRPRIPFMSDRLRAVQVDRAGRVWAATEVGLQRVRSDGTAFAVDAWTDVPGFLAFDLGARFLPEIVSPIAGSDLLRLAYDAARDRLYVGSARGLSRLRLDAEGAGTSGGLDVSLRPNPIRAAEEFYVEGFEGEADVEIYTVTGVLVHTARGVRAGELVWDTLNVNGERVVSGLYVVRVVRDGEIAIETLAVER